MRSLHHTILRAMGPRGSSGCSPRFGASRQLLVVAICLAAGTAISERSPHWAPSLQSKAYVIEKLSNGWRLMSPGRPYSVASSNLARHPAGHSIRFELRNGEAWNRPSDPSFRAEIDTDDYVAIGSVQWYGFSLYVPRDFPSEDNRCVMGQWHNKAKAQIGEADKSPAVAQRFRKGRFYVTVRHSDQRVVTDPDAVAEKVVFETRELPLGKWNDFVYQIKWSFRQDGFINAWLNRRRIIAYRGPVGYNDEIGPTFKFGLYRDDSAKTYVVYFDEYRRGRSLPEVDPAR